MDSEGSRSARVTFRRSPTSQVLAQGRTVASTCGAWSGSWRCILLIPLAFAALGSCQSGDDGPATSEPSEALGCLDFEDLTLGTTYSVADTVTTSGVSVDLQPFTLGNGSTTSNGFAEVEDQIRAGGSGLDLELNNVFASFDFGTPVDGLTLGFGEHGGNLNIEINGDFRNFDNLVEIDGTTVAGVDVAVVNGSGNDQGSLTLTGEIAALALGGQEFWIDDVCTGVAGEAQ